MSGASGRSRSASVSGTCAAPAGAVYALLADLGSHLEWAGRRQRRSVRLTALDGPPGPATAGTSFTSAGTIPGSGRRWQDRSEVVRAEPSSVFEFVTDATAPGRFHTWRARFRHTYRLEPDGQGCRVDYTILREWEEHPLPRMRMPMAWKVALPFLLARGHRNLLRMAEEQMGRVGPEVAV